MKHLFWICFFVGLIGCSADEPPQTSDDQRIVQTVTIGFDQSVVVPSSVLTFRMKGSDRLVPKAADVKFTGSLSSGREFDYGFIAAPMKFERVDGDQGDILIQVPVEEGFWSNVLPSPGDALNAIVTIELTDELGLLAEGELGGILLEFQPVVNLAVTEVPSGAYFVNERIEVTGSNFLRPEEGSSWAIANGVFTLDAGGTRDITNQRVPILWTGSRTRAEFNIAPGVFGVELGEFDGSLTFENELRTGEVFDGNMQPLFNFTKEQSFLGDFSTRQGSRGERIDLIGRGFVEQNSDAGYGMLLRFEGTFTYDDGGDPLDLTGANALDRQPDEVTSDQSGVLAVWYEISDGRLFGLGANPGVFDGVVIPILFDEFGEQIGTQWEGQFRILPTKQMVYIKYLPGFSKALEKFGVANIEFEIRRRVLETTNRDYAAYNVEFTDQPVTKFLDFSTIEIGGPDPTGGNKFGYDNTCNVQAEKCKDTDNLFLGDYLGGVNQASASEFNTPFGGVFIESFDYFSPTVNPGNEDASSEFDRVLGPFMPKLGGNAVRGTEFPGGDRDEKINEAIHMVGSVVGNTISHEVGHSLGLAFFPQDRIRPGEQFHNKIPCDWCIMDSGSQRPFSERGEVDDSDDPYFTPRNADYLLEILPRTE